MSLAVNQQPDRKNIPPYVPYRTFINFIDGLKVGVPSHIDKSVLSSLSGGMQSWLKSSLRYMKLIDAQSVPQDALFDLAHAEGAARKLALKELFESSYDPIRRVVELETTTPAKLESAFVQTGANGETVRKCVAFMLALAKDSGVELSPHLLKRASSPRRPRQKRQNGANSGGADAVGTANHNGDDTGHHEVKDQHHQPSGNWTEQLLAKFPSFDPAWTDELKAKWFAGFERLMDARKP